MKRLIALMFATTIALPQSAQASFRYKSMNVNPVGASSFEVVARRSTALADEYWCAASNYARRELKAGWQTTMYVSRSRAAAETADRSNSVQFTTDPSAAGITPGAPSVNMNAFHVGDNMTVKRADMMC